MQESDDDLLALLVGEFLDEKNAGKSPDLASFLARCPEGKRLELQDAVGFVAGEAPKANATPKRFGDFELLRELGRGGMGVVYEAKQLSVDRRVALKILSPWTSSDDTARLRLDREAHALAKLRHPGIVTIFAAGQEEGTRYFVMDLVPGKGLDAILADAKSKGARVATRQVLGWIEGVAQALAYAHEAGIVHRDVKPSNIRITPDGRAMLLDFGLARDASRNTMTMTGSFQGSPFYASPEQIEGISARIDGRTDVYSLGITLYECVAGCVPFQGETAEAVFRQVLAGEPVKPRFWNPELSSDLEIILLRAIDRDASRRYATARELAEDLRRCRENLPILARPDDLLYRLRKFTQRQTASILAAVALLAAGLAGWTTISHYAALAKGRATETALQESAPESGQTPSPQTALPEKQAQIEPTIPPLKDLSSDEAYERGRRAKELFFQSEEELRAITDRPRTAADTLPLLEEIKALMDAGVNDHSFSPLLQISALRRLALAQKTFENMEQYESNLLEAAAIGEAIPLTHPVRNMEFAGKLAGVYQMLSNFYADGRDREKGDYYDFKEEFARSSPAKSLGWRSQRLRELHERVNADYKAGNQAESKVGLLRIKALVELTRSANDLDSAMTAFNYYRLAVRQRQEMNREGWESNLLLAEKFGETGMKFIPNYPGANDLFTIYVQLTDCYEQKGDPDKAYLYSQKAQALMKKLGK